MKHLDITSDNNRKIKRKAGRPRKVVQVADDEQAAPIIETIINGGEGVQFGASQENSDAYTPSQFFPQLPPAFTKSQIAHVLGASDKLLDGWFPSMKWPITSDLLFAFENAFCLHAGSLLPALKTATPLCYEAVVLPRTITNSRLIWVKSRDGSEQIVSAKANSCRPGQQVLIRAGLNPMVSRQIKATPL
jgi:hypothetical protein